MPGRHELTGRKEAILRALVRHYIRTGEPVGSEVVAGESGLGVSSATIRNELAALEEMGYLTQPHTSAGRFPTDRAYRYYVDMLPTRLRLRDSERKAIVLFFDEALADVDEILRGTTRLLSNLTRYASLALAPSGREGTIAVAELVPLGTATLLLVVFESGQVEKRALDIPQGLKLDDEDIERLSHSLTEAFRGKPLKDARTEATDRAGAAPSPERVVLELVGDALESIGEAAEAQRMVLGGVANIAAEEDFHRHQTLGRIFEELERESEVLRLLRDAAAIPEVSVTIGRESAVTGIWEASVVAAPFSGGGGTLGTIGVVGPMRMDYAAAMSAVRAVADRLSAAVEALGG
jgi:heat-inducible transcriptional repressor